ncbi:MAG: hypothetical protein NTZ18_03150 [Candidatus Komeilibacteria bacterium]|nr:hypothetical protein [Candidatus Komeilibacteria bacterium]
MPNCTPLPRKPPCGFRIQQSSTGNILELYSSSTLALSVKNTGQTILSALPKISAPALLIQPYNTSSFSQTTSTMALVNAASGFTGDLLSLQVNGSTKFRIDYQGNASYYSTSVYGGDIIPGLDNTYDIGSLANTKRWRDVSLYRDLNIGAVNTADKLVRLSSTSIAVYNTDLTIQTNNSKNLLLNPSGNKVGIGSSTPAATLAIQSQPGQTYDLFRIGTSSNLILATTTDASFFKVSAGGNTTIAGKAINPTWVGQLSTSSLDFTRGVYVVGNYAYMTAHDRDALVIVDVSNPTSPTFISELRPDGANGKLDGARTIVVQGKYAYITSQDRDALSVVDISNPYNPVFVSELRPNGANGLLDGIYDIFVSGNYAYVANVSRDSLAIIDISNPYNPVFVSEVKNPNGNNELDGAAGVFVSGRYAYVTGYSRDSFVIIDVANPASPRFVSELHPSAVAFGPLDAVRGLFVRGKYAYVVSEQRNALTIIDISNPTSPTIVSEERGPRPGSGTGDYSLGGGSGIVVSGNYAYIALERGSFAVIDISNPLDPVFIAEVKNPGGNNELAGAFGLFVAGNYAYTANDGNDSLSIIDISGLTVNNAEIGTLKVGNMVVDSMAQFNSGMQIQGGLNVGKGAMFGGPVAINVSTSTSVGISALTVTATSSTDLIAFGQQGTGKILGLYDGVASSTIDKNLAFGVYNGGYAKLYATSTQTALRIHKGASNYLTVSNSGLVGIGTTTPKSVLSVSTLAQVSGNTKLFTVASTTGASLLTVLANGNVGISTSTPSYKLAVQGTSNSVGAIGADQVTNGLFSTDPSANWTYSGTWSWSSSRMNYTGTTGGVAAVTIDNGGTGYAVGNTLTITGGGGNAVLTVSTVSSGVITAVTIASAGTGYAVGAGKTVTGGAGSGATFSISRLSDSANTLSQNVSVIASSTYEVVYTVDYRTAGEVNVTLGGVSGHRISTLYNIVSQIITTNDTGNLIFTPTADFSGRIDTVSVKLLTKSTAIASFANSNGTTGIEVRSGGSNFYNTFIGVNAGISTYNPSSVYGFYNSAFGSQALMGNTTGTYNSAFGSQALMGNTTGEANTAIGADTLQFNTIGKTNIAVGAATLKYNTTGSNNTAVGYGTLFYNTTGLNNTTFGYGAGYIQTTASNNIYLGYQAGDNITTGSNNIVIGYDINAPSATASNQLNIGNLIFGTGIDGTGNILSTGKIGIGTTTPAAKFAASSTSNIVAMFDQRGTSDILRLNDAGTTVFKVQDGGYVGVGTNTPKSVLSVSTLAQASGNTKLFTVASTTGASLFQVLGNGNTSINGNTVITGNATTTGKYYVGGDFKTNANATTTGSYYIGNSLTVAGASLFSNPATFNSTINGQTISSAANFTGSLTTAGNINTTGGVIQTNSVTRIDNSGNLTNIGTITSGLINGQTITSAANFTGSLNVAGNTTLQGTLAVTGNQTFAGNFSVGGRATITAATGNIQTRGNIYATGTLAIDGQSIFRDKIGIGTTSPKSMLSVSTLAQQASNYKLFTVASTTGASLFQVQGSGLVGIGTTTPVANLTVAGSVSGRSFNGNTAASWGGPWFATGTKDLLAWYPLGKRDSQNGKMSDISGNEHHGTITAGSSAGFVADWSGRMESAYDFDGADTKIDTGSDWIGTQAVTISAWIYADGWGESDNGMILFNNKLFIGVKLTTDEGYVENIWASNNNASIIHSASYSITLGNWYHVVVTRNSAGTGNIYINGVQSGEANHNFGTPEAGTTNVIIGNSTGQTVTFDGRISDLRVYNRVLSAGEVAGLYNGSESTYATRVGIGTTTPQSVLSVTTALQQAASTKLFTVASTTGATLFQVLGNGQTIVGSGGAAGSNKLTVNGNSVFIGNVGIGTTTPAAKLSLASPGSLASVFQVDVPSTYTGNLIDLKIASSSRLVFKESSSGLGRLGVGTSTPSARVSISATAQTSLPLLRVASTTNATLLTVESTGKVGIGLSNPSAYLHVQGTNEQLRLSYNSTAYWSNTVNASGTATLFATGRDPGFNFQVRDTTALTVNDVQITSNVPLQIAQSGDVGVAGDILMSNGTASYITGENPLTIRTYNPSASVDLTLTAANNGVVVIDDALEIYGTTTIALTQTSANAVNIKDHWGTNIFNINNLTTSSLRTFTFGPNNGAVATATGIQIGYGGICVDNDGNCQASTTGRVTARSFGTAGSDVAENYPSVEHLAAGDLVMADPNNPGYIIKTTGEYDNNVIGVISETPGIIMGSEVIGYPVALVGRIPTKVSNVNGEIKPGDLLTVAPIAGYAMKFNEGDTSKIIGTALDSFNGAGASTDGLISMFVNPDYKSVNNPQTFGLITDGQIATNAAISDIKLATISTKGKIMVSALPVEIALLQGDTQTFTGNYIFGKDANTADLVVLNAKLGSDIKFAADNFYNIGSAAASAANIYTKQLNSSKIVVAADMANMQNMNLDDYGLYLAASSGNALFGDNAIVGARRGAPVQVALPEYPDFVMNGGDLLVNDDLGVRGDLYVVGDIRVAGAIEFAKEGIAQMMNLTGEYLISGNIVVVNASGTSQGKVAALANSSEIIGVIGTNSAAIFGQNNHENNLPVIVSGMAIVNVSAENGSIKRGDKLTTADSAGYAQLATRPGAGVLGIAAEDLSEGQGKIKVLVDLGTYFAPLAKVITVGSSGSDYKTITKALNSINDNSNENRYLIKVAPGVYNEQIILKDYVDVVGEGSGLVTVKSDKSPVVIASANARLEGATISSNNSSSEPMIVSINNDNKEIILKDLKLDAATDNPAVGVSITGNSGKIMLSELTFNSNFTQGIVNLGAADVSVMNSDLSSIIGTALSAQNGRVLTYNNNFNGVLGDINVAQGARVESTGDQYAKVSNAGVFLDKTNRGKVDSDYIDYGWLAEQSAGLQINISAGQGYVNGVKVNTAAVGNLAVNASSTNYIFMTDEGNVLATTTPNPLFNLPLDKGEKERGSVIIATVQTSISAITSISNERANEITVAKQGGKFRTITDALNSITSASEHNRWTIRVGSGVYNEQIVLKPFVEIIGQSKDSTTILGINKSALVAGVNATTTASVKVSNLKLSLAGDITGQAVVSASSTDLTLEDVNLTWSGSEGINGTAVEVNGNSNITINRLNISNIAYGIVATHNYASLQNGLTFVSTSTVAVSYSTISSSIADIKTICINTTTNQDCGADVPTHNYASPNIISSYNTLSGTGTNFEVAKGTIISSAHDTYLKYTGEGEFRQNDYFRNNNNPTASLFNIQNAGFNLFNVSASGTVAINPQNTTGDSVVISSPTASSTLTVVNTGAGTALKVVGNVILTSATSGIPVVLSSAGAELNVGAPGDTINLNLEGVVYNFKENVRKDTMSAYLSAPVSGDHIWGSSANAWSPSENITVLGVKVQYSCADGGVLQMVLKDKNGNVIANLDGYSCGGFYKIEQNDLQYHLTPDDGMYVDVVSSTEGVTNVTVTIEFVYDNR